MRRFSAGLRQRLTYANLVSSICLFILLGGAAYAATALPNNSVGTKQLKNKAVTLAKISNGAQNALRGHNGTNGRNGAPGPQGAKGDTGAQGPQGAKGDACLFERPRVQGTPGTGRQLDRYRRRRPRRHLPQPDDRRRRRDRRQDRLRDDPAGKPRLRVGRK